MKFSRSFKISLLVTMAVLYVSGVAKWALDRWMSVDHGMGLEPPAQSIWFLRAHGITGLWFLLVFGYLYHSHVRRGWLARRKLRSGLALVLPLGLVIATVPLIYYVTDESVKNAVTVLHVYLGMLLALPFFVHMLTKNKRGAHDERS